MALFDPVQQLVFDALSTNQLKHFTASRAFTNFKCIAGSTLVLWYWHSTTDQPHDVVCVYTVAGSLSTRASLVRASTEMGSKRTQSIDVIQRVISRKSEAKRVFGVPLAIVLKTQSATMPAIPTAIVVYRTIEFLMAHGLDDPETFRNEYDKQVVLKAKEVYDTGMLHTQYCNAIHHTTSNNLENQYKYAVCRSFNRQGCIVLYAARESNHCVSAATPVFTQSA
jgi:hypothetical protein